MATKKVCYDITGKVALITGNSTGIGAAIATKFALTGAKVVITGHVASEVAQMQEQIHKLTDQKPLSIVGSLIEEKFAETLVRETVSKYGRIDVLVNNAGRLCVDGSFNDPNLMDKYDQVMELNVRAVFRMTQLCVPHLERTKGSIVNMASVAGFGPCVNAVYSTSKAAVNMITKCAALDLFDKGIRVNSVNPGPIRTALGNSMDDPTFLQNDSTNPLVPHTIMKRLGEPEEVANMVLFLASNQASYITGVNNVVDGGYLCL